MKQNDLVSFVNIWQAWLWNIDVNVQNHVGMNDESNKKSFSAIIPRTKKLDLQYTKLLLLQYDKTTVVTAKTKWNLILYLFLFSFFFNSFSKKKNRLVIIYKFIINKKIFYNNNLEFQLPWQRSLNVKN